MDTIFILLVLLLIGATLLRALAVIDRLPPDKGWYVAKLKSLKLHFPQRAIWALLMSLFVLGQAAVSQASTPTPIPPTSTPVPLDIPINVVMSSTNGWISTFAPIAAIGIGISIALVILAWLGKMIRGAFS